MEVGDSPSITSNANPGIDERVGPGAAGCDGAAVRRAAASSSARVVVVPTAITRRPSARALLMAAAAVSLDLVRFGIDGVLLDALDAHRLERAVADVQRDGRRVRRPVRRARPAICGVKWRPAVGAATDPRSAANIV